jgi:FlaA1/EpsC-like NDP-sugar epimerase
MERYFMTVREACQLIMQAATIGEGGEIFVLDMGEPVRISYLAEQMIRLSGNLPGGDIRIEYTGLRPGEKLYEELFHEREELLPTSHAKIRQARHREMGWELINQLIREFEEASAGYDNEAMWKILNRFVPERLSHGTDQGKGEVVQLHS